MESQKDNQKKYKISSYSHPSGVKFFSFNTILLEDWFVKASISSVDSICVVMQNINTGAVRTGFFTDESQANQFINSLIYSSPVKSPK